MAEKALVHRMEQAALTTKIRLLDLAHQTLIHIGGDLSVCDMMTGQLVLTVGYDRESLTDPACPPYHGPVTTDHYGRRVPKAAHGSENFQTPTASSKEFLRALTALFDRIVDRGLLVRRMYVVANRVQREQDVRAEPEYVQLDLFSDETALAVQRAELLQI